MSPGASQGPRGSRAPPIAPVCCAAAALGMLLWSPASQAFNLDVEKLTVYSGPEGSYFGYAVDFYIPDARTASVLVGAPKANTSQPNIVEGGAVYYCPWPAEGSAQCRQIPFDTTNNRKIRVNGTKEPIEFKSNQWFGATVKAHKGKVVACAPLYHWRTLKPTPEKDPVGTCYVAIQNFSAYAEFSPCRNSNADPEGQGYCQAGFSLDFYKVLHRPKAAQKLTNVESKHPSTEICTLRRSYLHEERRDPVQTFCGRQEGRVGQVITASVADIIANYSFKDILRKLAGEKQTEVAPASYDDSYLGYSVAAGEFTGDSQQELVAGVPRGAQNFGYVSIINSTDMTFIQNFTGEQMASYFGYTVVISDVNSDGLDDVLVGAPLFMEREFESNPREVGQIYLYLQVSSLLFRDPQILIGTETFGRFGSAMAHLGDLNQDGYNDIAIGVPFAGKDQRGKVLIYNGNKGGLNTKPSQVLEGVWASQAVPSGFGFTLRGDSDIDKNDYPDLIVGAFGTGKVAVYRARPVVTVDAQLLLNPVIINLENKTCQIPDSTTSAACFSLRVCASVRGQSISNTIVLMAEVQLDSLKQKGAIKRTLFLDNHQAHRVFPLVIKRQKSSHQCQDFIIYLRDETEFRDKLSPINISLNYSLDESTFKEGLEVKPILNYYRENIVSEQAHILVDCGEDNLCVPDLKLSARPDKHQVIIGDENHLMLIINVRNEGEGAYEAELFVMIPEEADYVGIERNNKGFRPLSCEYKMENVTRMVVCDLGNPMVSGTNYSLGLRFAVPRLEKTNMSINFDLQIRSSNKDNPDSNSVSLQINITAVAQVEIRGVSHPPQIVLPIHNWEPEEEPRQEEEVGPLVEHIYELHNIGPSTISDTLLEVGWPFSARDEFLLYIFHIQTLGPLQCQTNPDINPQDLKPAASPEDTPELSAFLRNSTIPHLVRKRDVPVVEFHRQSPAKILNCTNIECLQISCAVGRLEGGESAVLKVRSRLWAHTFLQRKNDPYALASLVSFEVKKMPYKDQPAKLPEGSMAIKTSVIWATPNVSFSIPLWVIILAILLGLLVLAILTLALWKCGFFDRARPPQEDMTDKQQLTNDKTSEA
ncbi:integrin alpha-8 [Cebus imitator]|uniref:integrin alpha-8 n=1 Tax=Cebus imitator TaxID=2715852 RepID=UPI0018997643|nr:integrin alpha-8 [Cebus imitator]